MKCAQCGQKPTNRCNKEGFDCTGGKLDLTGFTLPQNRDFLNLSEHARSEHGNSQTRLEEIIEFAKRAGYTKLGVAFCVSMAKEAAIIVSILENFFKVDSVCCKVAGLNKDEHGIAKINKNKFEVACNPIGQAQILNRAKTDLNIQVGLCIGHDILFQQYAEAPVTVLVVKDRVQKHNPMGVAGTSYWQKKLNIKN